MPPQPPPRRNALRRFMDKNSIGIQQMADQLGVAHSVVWRWRAGERIPELRFAFKIEDLTMGAVPARSWLGEVSTVSKRGRSR